MVFLSKLGMDMISSMCELGFVTMIIFECEGDVQIGDGATVVRC